MPTRNFDIARRAAMLGAVLKEMRNARQDPVADRRRWLDDDGLLRELVTARLNARN